MSSWFQNLTQYYTFPRDYTTIDLETNGLSPETCEICVLGHTAVRNGIPSTPSETYINWWADPDVDHAAIEKRLLDTEKVMKTPHSVTGKVKTFLHTKEKLLACGRPPKEVFAEYLQLFEDLEARNETLVSHNGVAFDLPFLVAHLHNVLRINWKFREDLVYDTGIIFKSSQMATVPQPKPGETFYEFLRRVSRTPAKGVRWALDGHAEDTFHLREKAGVDESLAHTAGVDSLLTAYLYEEQRALATAGVA